MNTIKMAPRDSFGSEPQGRVQDRHRGGVEGREGKLNVNYLRLIPALCLEDKKN